MIYHSEHIDIISIKSISAYRSSKILIQEILNIHPYSEWLIFLTDPAISPNNFQQEFNQRKIIFTVQLSDMMGIHTSKMIWYIFKTIISM